MVASRVDRRLAVIREHGGNSAALDALLDEHESLREEFIVCGAAGYPDPIRPWPQTRSYAFEFAREHTTPPGTTSPGGEVYTPVVKRRLISEWEVIDA